MLPFIFSLSLLEPCDCCLEIYPLTWSNVSFWKRLEIVSPIARCAGALGFEQWDSSFKWQSAAGALLATWANLTAYSRSYPITADVQVQAQQRVWPIAGLVSAVERMRLKTCEAWPAVTVSLAAANSGWRKHLLLNTQPSFMLSTKKWNSQQY